jgi:uncharacterized protein YqeY
MLKEKILKDLNRTIKERKEIEVSTLRLLLSAIFNKEKEKRYKLSKQKPELTEKDLEKESQLVDEEVIEVISSEIKKRKESIELFEKGQRQDLVEKETKEKEILEKYLPEQLSEEEIKKLVKEVIDKTGAKEIKDMGKVMAELIPKVKGKADGATVSKIVKELLTPKIE